jgi:transcriptional regulator with XRE-family HTH domain
MSLFQARFGEDTYPIGQFILDRARALGLSRSELVRRLGYRKIGNGHRALSELLTMGTVPPQIAKHLADALEVDEALVAAVMAATARQQQDEASQRILARETAYRTAFRPHLRCETEREIPEPLFIAALLTSARLRLVPVCSGTWQVSADERDRLLKRAIQDHYSQHAGRITAFGAIVGYTAVVMPGYLLDFGVPYDLNGDPMGPMGSVKRLGEAVLGTKPGDSRLTGLFRDTPVGILA